MTPPLQQQIEPDDRVAELLRSIDPDTLEAIADEIQCFEHSARCRSLRVLAKMQRAALARWEGK